MGDLKLSLEERQRALGVTRSQLSAVRREAGVERLAQEEKARFEAHRPSRYLRDTEVAVWWCNQGRGRGRGVGGDCAPN